MAKNTVLRLRQFSLAGRAPAGRGSHAARRLRRNVGKDLFQTLDGDPRLPFSAQRRTRRVVSSGCGRTPPSRRTALLQTQLDKRFSRGLSAGVDTWSRFEDTASEIFNPSAGEVAVAQDSFNPFDGERGRSTYDRPHRLSGNFVYELPWGMDTQGIAASSLAAGRSAPSSRCRAAPRSPF